MAIPSFDLTDLDTYRDGFPHALFTALRREAPLTFWEMSANRDERVFREPFRFDVARDPNPHLGFGQGRHHCLGANLARLEMRVMFEELFARFAKLEITGPAVWTREHRLLGLKHLPMRLRRA